MEYNFERFKFVLARPSESGNIGFACRAMKTMGFTRLCIAGAENIDPEQVRIFSVHAFDVFEKAEIVPTLREALADVAIAAGITRRRGEKRKRFSFLPEDFAEKAWSLPDGDIAVVFGCERTGLSDEEISLCPLAVHIPSSELFPSLNLSHAVQVIAYELFRHATGGQSASYQPVSLAQVEGLSEGILGNLKAIGFHKQGNPEDTRKTLRDIFARAALSKGELDYLEYLFNKIEHLKGNPQ
jgi:TrmH family RNA methyltransferase